MSDVFERISKKYLDCFNAIKTLYKNGIMDEADEMLFRNKLLDDIVVTFESEVNE